MSSSRFASLRRRCCRSRRRGEAKSIGGNSMYRHIMLALSIAPCVSCWPLPRFVPLSILAIMALPAMAIAQAGPTNPMAPAQFVAGPAEAGDPYLWLEDVSSPKALEWVKVHNADSIAALESDPR